LDFTFHIFLAQWPVQVCSVLVFVFVSGGWWCRAICYRLSSSTMLQLSGD